VILGGNVSSVRFAGSLRFAVNGTFRAKSVTREMNDDRHEEKAIRRRIDEDTEAADGQGAAHQA
jgi:hypothetical protein